jgi:hypothetical protein
MGQAAPYTFIKDHTEVERPRRRDMTPLRNKPGARWNADEQRWMRPEPPEARALRLYLEDKIDTIEFLMEYDHPSAPCLPYIGGQAVEFLNDGRIKIAGEWR